jgi:hypothetical protein
VAEEAGVAFDVGRLGTADCGCGQVVSSYETRLRCEKA